MSKQAIEDRSQAVLDAVRVLSHRFRGRAPTMREIADQAGLRSVNTSWLYVRRLEKAGKLVVEKNGSVRGIRLVLEPGDACPYCGQLQAVRG